MSLKSTMIRGSVRLDAFFLEIFPRAPYGTAAKFAAKLENDPNAREIVQTCEHAISNSTDEVAELLVRHIRDKFAREDERQASAIGRAQALFFAVALLTSILTLGASLVSTANSPPLTELYVVAALSAMILYQVYFLVRNLLKAIEGIPYLRPGSSEITRWAGLRSKGAVYRDEAARTLQCYRDASRKNTWRFMALDRALKALRNIIVCVCVLVAVFFGFAVFQHHHEQSAPPTQLVFGRGFSAQTWAADSIASGHPVLRPRLIRIRHPDTPIARSGAPR